MARDVTFGFVAAAADAPGTGDPGLYSTLLDDIDYHARLGFGTAWFIEHHFSDYFPTPSPLVLMAHVAGRFPDLSLGTCVLVTPWYDPLRLAGEIAMLSLLTRQELHLGLGRGTAKYEYDAFGIDMDEGRNRFKEAYDILRLALSGEPFTYAGSSYPVPKRVSVRPRVADAAERIRFYGAIGTPGSAAIMAQLGLPPICTTIGDLDVQRNILKTWRGAQDQAATVSATTFPLMINCIVCDTDAEAVRQAQEYVPRFMQAQIDHYTPDETDWESMETYKGWKGQFESMKMKTDPANIPAWTGYQLVGSPDTVIARIRQYADAGFNHFLLHSATPGVPHSVRREWSRRFAEDVAPAFAGHLTAATS